MDYFKGNALSRRGNMTHQVKEQHEGGCAEGGRAHHHCHSLDAAVWTPGMCNDPARAPGHQGLEPARGGSHRNTKLNQTSQTTFYQGDSYNKILAI